MEGTTLNNQIAIVTGASSGIGQGIAFALGKAGAKVVVNYHSNAEGAQETVEKLKSFGTDAIAVKGDVSKEQDVITLFQKAIAMFDAVDIVVPNAGIQIDYKLHEMALEDWQKVIDINLTGQFLCAREAVKLFLKQGVRDHISKAAGKLIHISSVHDVIPWSGHVNYAASKGGIDMLMKSICQGYAVDKIRCNAISPGAIATKINENARDTEEERKEMLKLIPYGRIGQPKDIGEVAAWLASDHSDYINGETIYVDGGMTTYPGFKGNG
ncbi:glucose 1-dehydrogenase [Flavobacterium sp. ASW18X]|uniref:glucose 1-dehydrogenase n=1 Tax=Flavobacterium sp. ASW18X TaxID=2572595 RepID=UPI0010AE1BB5|nr:glucose 1-dehydrogenase [Flavobacterium sp. ASW18X]TKD66041.1 glucose 1-dehydrogenase [Flavobacterium sp. ASW18X]